MLGLLRALWPHGFKGRPARGFLDHNRSSFRILAINHATYDGPDSRRAARHATSPRDPADPVKVCRRCISRRKR